MNLNDDVWIINSHRNRAHRGRITGTDTDEIGPILIVTNDDKGAEVQEFDADTLEAVGDYWSDTDIRPIIAAADDPSALALRAGQAHRAYAVKVREAANDYANKHDAESYDVLRTLIDNWK